MNWMTRFRFRRNALTPQQVIANRHDDREAGAIINDLRTAGYIIVRHDAIRNAQREAAAQVREAANDNFRRKAA
jgi:hypothetical protein